MFVAVCSAKCRQRKWRRTEKGKAQYVEYNKRYKRPEIKKTCIHCKLEFSTTRKKQELCSKCSRKKSAYYSQKKYREKNIEKRRAWYETHNRSRNNPEHYFPETCSIKDCDMEGERHHPDYSKPLEIVWLCIKHHRELHSKEHGDYYAQKRYREKCKEEAE